MKYSEVFHSIQGEGKLVGTPSVFVRTSFCNLRCAWCDTPYTSWEPEDRDISVDELLGAVANFGCRHVVITGGEPFIQERELAELCARLREGGKHVTVETNATVFAPVAADLISMSPKLRNSTPVGDTWEARHEDRRIAPDVIRAFLAAYECQVKFVLDAPDDIDEVHELRGRVPIAAEDIILMPQGLTADETQRRMAWLSEACTRHGYRLSPRMHVDIWGAKRGV
ncbi:radical SAM protein [Candidatus Poribacteria bacterium]|nr:radical SAM protein [Candidatus Poribacteria bacterium]